MSEQVGRVCDQLPEILIGNYQPLESSKEVSSLHASIEKQLLDGGYKKRGCDDFTALCKDGCASGEEPVVLCKWEMPDKDSPNASSKEMTNGFSIIIRDSEEVDNCSNEVRTEIEKVLYEFGFNGGLTEFEDSCEVSSKDDRFQIKAHSFGYKLNVFQRMGGRFRRWINS